MSGAEEAHERVVIVGAGQSGADLAAALREKGFAREVVLIGEESVLPYSRPPLSKAYLRGQKTRPELLIRAAEMYDKHGIDVRLDRRVEAIDTKSRRVMLDDGSVEGYGWLVLATGGEARTLPDERVREAGNTFTLRTVDDIDRMRAHFSPGRRLLVIGGGYVGLEAASVARELGLEVILVEREERVLARVTAPPMSEFLARVHRERGVTVLTGRGIESMDFGPEGNLRRVRIDDGTSVALDVCLIGIGIRPRTELAEQAGLEVADGIIVDEHQRTSDPRILAIGDVARHPCGERGGTRRLESVANAGEQARLAADTILGTPRPYAAVPWFWSDQYELKLQMVGLADPGDEVVVREDRESGRMIAVFYLRQGRLRAAEVVSSPRDFAVAKKLVAQQAIVSPSDLGDPDVRLGALLETVASSAASTG